jgi:branched-chain amino acid transport system substrate-binding protein
MGPIAGLLLAVLKIGYFGPADGAHPAGGSLWQGVSLAFEAAPEFELVSEWDESPWTGGASKVVRLAYADRVLALIGGIDGASTHLAEQVVTKALLPLVDPASTDRTVNAAFVPWVFSVMPDDRALMGALAATLVSSPDRDSFVLVAATDHDSRRMKAEFLAALQQRRARPLRVIDVHAGRAALVAGLPSVRAVVVLAGPADSAALVRAAPRGIRIYGGPAMSTRTFLRLAREAAEGVRFADPLASSDRAAAFRQEFERRFGEPPDSLAFHAFDAAEMLLAAVRRAGPDRAAIRNALRELSPWNGVSGLVRWDPVGRNERPAAIAEIGVSAPRLGSRISRIQ